MKGRALLIYTHPSTFVKGDREILEERFQVEDYHFKNSPKAALPLSLIKQLFFLLFKLPQYRVVYIWFADYHSWLPTLIGKLYRKEVIVVAGGYDLARERRYGYGSFSKQLRGFLTLQSLNRATKVLAVSQYIHRVIKAIAPKANSQILYNGITFSDRDFKKGVDIEQPMVLCVAIVNRAQTLYIKGIDRYLAVVKALPNIKFGLVGCNRALFNSLFGDAPSNLTLIEAIPHSQLKEYYQRATLYCQLSRRESFSMALAEAMWYNVPPIVSATGGIPEVVGDRANVIYLNDHPLFYDRGIEQVVTAIEIALKSDNQTNYRKRVEEHFTLSIRRERLLALLP